MDVLEECHNRLARLLGENSEPLEVLRCAEAHRAYWRPPRIRILLLAESHIYTAFSEMDRQVILQNHMDTDMPRGFVRLVYCLGYGENNLLNKPIREPSNSGTPKYWKILYSCVNRVSSNEDFIPILKSYTAFEERIRNKIALLKRLKEAGIWLLDASLAALYPKPVPTLVESCLQVSWDAYVSQIVRTTRPSSIICIGKGVFRFLHTRLCDIGIPVFVIPQPNSRLSSLEHLKNYQQYHDIICQSCRL
jgi:hypothetical protein